MNLKDFLHEHRDAHLAWLIVLLAVSLVVVLSVKISDNTNIKDIINTSLALASLILALVAIFQALLAGNDLSSAISSIHVAVDKIYAPATLIEEASTVLTRHSEDLKASTVDLTSRIESFSSNQTVLRDESFDKEAVHVNNGAQLALYLCKKSFQARKSFNSAIFKDEGLSAGEFIFGYVSGFISSLKATNSMEIEIVDSSFLIVDLKLFSEIDISSFLMTGLESPKALIDRYFDA